MNTTKTIRIYAKNDASKKMIARAHLGPRHHLEVFQEAYRSTLQAIFDTPRVSGLTGARGPLGTHVLAARGLLEPWSEAALEEVIELELPRIGLRAELSASVVRSFRNS